MLGGPDSLFLAVEEWLAWSKRHKASRSIVRQTIEAEGGEIDRISMIGFLLRSPFPPINLRPVYLKATCRYPNDVGTWFICGTDGGKTHWVWCSDRKAQEPPVERSEPFKVDHGVVALPRWLSIMLYIVFVLGLIGGFYLCVLA